MCGTEKSSLTLCKIFSLYVKESLQLPKAGNFIILLPHVKISIKMPIRNGHSEVFLYCLFFIFIGCIRLLLVEILDGSAHCCAL